MIAGRAFVSESDIAAPNKPVNAPRAAHAPFRMVISGRRHLRGVNQETRLLDRTPLPRRLRRRMSYVCANLVFVERELVSGWGEVRIHISIADGTERRW